jgi:hypothetical protein
MNKHKHKLVEYPGDPIVYCVIDDHRTAHAELRSKEEARNLATLNGRMFNGVPLRPMPWDYARPNKEDRRQNESDRAMDNDGGNQSVGQDSLSGPRSSSRKYPTSSFTTPSNFLHQVFLNNPPQHTTHAIFREFINSTLKDLKLCDNSSAIRYCYSFGSGTWIMGACSPEMADRLMYLHGMDANGLILRLSRHYRYRGPSPKYNSFREFEQQRQAKLAANENSQPAPSLLTIDDHSDSKNTIMDSTVQASSEVPAPLVEESSAQARKSDVVNDRHSLMNRVSISSPKRVSLSELREFLSPYTSSENENEPSDTLRNLQNASVAQNPETYKKDEMLVSQTLPAPSNNEKEPSISPVTPNATKGTKKVHPPCSIESRSVFLAK